MWRVVLLDDQVRANPRTGRPFDPGGRGSGARGKSIRLTAARNEYASFQLLIGPLPRRERAYRITFSDLTGPGGRISRREVEAYVAWSVRAGGGWYPDVLVPLEAVGGAVPAPWRDNRVPAQRWQTVWVDLFVPPEAEPGPYTGTVSVSEGRREVSLELSLTALPFTIPDSTSIHLDLNNYVDGISSGWPDLIADPDRHRTERYLRIERGFFRAAHEHRACFHYLPYLHSGYIPPTFAPELEGRGEGKRVRSWRWFDRHFSPYLDGSAFAGTRRGPIPVPRFWLPLNLTWPADFTLFGTPGYEAEWRAVGRQMVEHFRERGWTRTTFDFFLNHKQRYRLFPWDCEEVRFPADNAIHYIFRDLWRGTFDWPNTKPIRFAYTLGITWLYGIDTVSPMKEFVEVWIGSPGGEAEYHHQTPEIRARGQEIWMCGTFPAIPEPISSVNWWPLTTWMRGVDGFMAWLTLGWGEEPTVAPPGDGATCYLYPGARFGLEGPVVSLRLKVLRNAMQTMEWLETAAEQLGRDVVEKLVCRAMGLTGPETLLTRRPDRSRSPGRWGNVTARHWRNLRNALAPLLAGRKTTPPEESNR